MADHDATQPLNPTPTDERSTVKAALAVAHGALIGTTAVLARWLSMDASDPRPFDAEFEADPADSDYAFAIETLLDRADSALDDAVGRFALLRSGADMGPHERALSDAWTMIGGIKQLVHAAGLASDEAALRPEAGAAVLTVVAWARDEIDEHGAALFEAEQVEA